MLWADEIWPQDIGAIGVLDGSAWLGTDGRVPVEMVEQAVAGRLHLVPRLRQILYEPPPGLGGPLWVDAPSFDLANHIHVLALPEHADEAQLLAAVERIRSRRLERSHPLWELWLLPGLPDRQVGLFVRTHHCLADGIAGVATLGALLDTDPNAIPSPAPPWTPAPRPVDGDLRADVRLTNLHERRRVLSALAHPVHSARNVLDAWPAIHELIAERPLPPTSLDRLVRPGRRFALVRGRLGVIKSIAHTHDAKVNDVFLAAIAGGVSDLMRSRGERIDAPMLRVYVPVSLRHGLYANARGNQISQMVVPLPVTVADPALRLRQIAAATAMRKERSRPSVGKMPHSGFAGRMFLKLAMRQRVNVTTADLPGPPVPVYLAGARLLEVFPVLPLMGTISLGVGALSYAGQFNIAAVADRDSYPDIDVFAAGVRRELDALALESSNAAVA